MIIETFDMTTIYNKRGKPPTVSLEWGERNKGQIYFSIAAVKNLKLREGMRIAFRTYSTDPDIIYFYEQATGLMLVKKNDNKSGVGLAIYCRPLCKSLLAHFGFKDVKRKTFSLKADMVQMPETNCNAWMINKSNVHKPIKWRKNNETL